MVDVTPRAEQRWAKLPVSHHDATAAEAAKDNRTPTEAVQIGTGFTAGERPSACTKSGLGGVLCPDVTVKGTLDGKAYALAQVSDPGGPFAGFFYAGGTPLKIDRVALYNPNESAASKHKYPDGTKGVTWYDYNAAHHGDELAAYLAAVHDHEGWGQGAARRVHPRPATPGPWPWPPG